MQNPARLYLDANATTPVAPEALAAMLPFLGDDFGNPSSAHASGQRTRSAVEHARGELAALLGTDARSIVFTSGGTESNNLAIAGVLQPYLDHKEPVHLITTQIEHHAVLNAAEAFERRGVAVTYLAPDSRGLVSGAALEQALRPETRFVSIMLANNETGVIQPIGKLARITKQFAERHGSIILVHTDAVQAVGKLQITLGAADGGGAPLKNVDLLSLSGHKMYAPQGTGALFVRKGVALAPLFHGGPHERSRRAGTENVPGIVALGTAATLALRYMRSAPIAADAVAGPRSDEEELGVVSSHAAKVRDGFEQRVLAALPDTRVNGAMAARNANTTNILFEGVDAEALLIALDVQGIAASFGAACQSGATEPSHVLLAMGISKAQARASLRFSFLRDASAADAQRAADILVATVERLRRLR